MSRRSETFGALCCAGLLGLIVANGPATAAPQPYVAPEETASLAPGPNVDVAQANCVSCHSAEYVSSQPRTFPNPTAFWTAEVAKMRAAYGAPIEPADAAKIVEYLAAVYGKPTT